MFHSLVFWDSVEGSSVNFGVVLPYGLTRLPSTDLNWKILSQRQSCSCSTLRPHPAHSTAQSCRFFYTQHCGFGMRCTLKYEITLQVLTAVRYSLLTITSLSFHKHSHADLIKNTIVREISFEYLFISFWNFLHLKMSPKQLSDFSSLEPAHILVPKDENTKSVIRNASTDRFTPFDTCCEHVIARFQI